MSYRRSKLYTDCVECDGGTVVFGDTKNGICRDCGARYQMSTRGGALYIDAVSGPSRSKGKRGKSSKKKAKGRSSSKAANSVKRLFVNFIAVMIFVTCMVVVLAASGGG